MKTLVPRKIRAYIVLFSGKFNVFLDKFNKLTKREKLIAVFTGVFILIVFIDQGVVQPLKRNIEGLGQKISAQEVRVLQNYVSTAQKPQVDQIYVSLLENLDNSKTNDEEIRADILHDVELLARSNSIYLSEVKPQVSVESENLTDFFVRLQIEGEMEKFVRFIRDLVATKKLYYVETIRVTQNPNEPNKIKATLSIARSVIKGSIPSS